MLGVSCDQSQVVLQCRGSDETIMGVQALTLTFQFGRQGSGAIGYRDGDRKSCGQAENFRLESLPEQRAVRAQEGPIAESVPADHT